MKNKLFPLLLMSTSLLIGLVGCNKEDVPEDPEEQVHYSYAAKSFETSKKIMTLGVGETGSFLTRISPLVAYDARLVYSSANSEVASVDANGLITANKVGNTTIKVEYERDPKVYAEVMVTVINRLNPKSQELTNKVNDALKLQKTLPAIDNLYYREYRDYAIYCNDVMTYNSIEYSDYYQSKSDAFFSISAHEDEMKTAGGNYEPSDYAWIIHTDESFETHMYHVSGTTKTMIDVATQSYMEKGKRVDAVVKLLSSLFTKGSKLFEQGYTDVLGTKNLEEDFTTFRSYVTEGYVGDGIIGYSLEQTGAEETMDAEDEDDYNIPYGTKVTPYIKLTSVWKDGIVVAVDYTQIFSYEIDGNQYRKEWKVYNSYATGDMDLPYPNDKEFRVVDQLYDL